MNTEKKNQHYIPKFYLRNFSYHNNKKQIGLFNINNEIFIPNAKLKTQGSKNFFYGYDGKIEDKLANIEGRLAEIIKSIIRNKNLPKMDTQEYSDLLYFVTLTDLRNPVKIEGLKDSLNEAKTQLLKMDPDIEIEKFVPTPSHDQIVKIILSHVSKMTEMIKDLGCKIIVNKTANPFICSNFPVVKYNQYLELKKWPHSKSGYGLTGLQIFLPLNYEITLVLFDNGIYKLGEQKKRAHITTNIRDIDQINILQFLNCLDTIYFDEKSSENYIRSLHLKAKQFKKANSTFSKMGYLIKEGDIENQKNIDAGFKNFMQINKSDCEINLKIEGLKIHSKGKNHQLSDTLAQLRPHAALKR